MSKGAYSGLKKIFSRYWKAYGGWSAVFKSPYFHLSILLTCLSHSIWINPNWVEIPISVLPNIIGFSLGGYAIWLALGDDKFRASISIKSKEDKESPFMVVNSTFVHFIVLQIVSLLIALAYKAAPIQSLPDAVKQWLARQIESIEAYVYAVQIFTGALGYLIFVYAIMSALAATMAIYRIAGWLDIYHMNKANRDKKLAEQANKEQ